MLDFIYIFSSAFFLSLLSTWLISRLALAAGIVDKPGAGRKIHQKEIPLMGGLALFVSFFIVAYFFRDKLLAGNLDFFHWAGVFFGASLIMFGGYLDDRFGLSPKKQIIFPILAVLLVIAGGVEIEKITNPFGGFVYFDTWNFTLFNLGGHQYVFTVLSDIFIFIWLLGMSYTTKILDGMDGLVTGVTAIGALVIFIFTMSDKYYQPDIGVASLILFAVCLGFLIFNWHPASIFLGEGGSLLLGFLLGVLAIISGGKIAIALLVMGVPILDLAWTIIRRMVDGKNPFSFADRKHLHFRLYDLGLGQRRTVLLFYLLSVFFGLSAVFLQSIGKLYALGFLLLLMIFFVVLFRKIEKNEK